MQKISVDTLCDNTAKHGEDEVPAESLPPITVGRDKPRLLDLCGDCRLELAEPLLTLLDKQGRAEDTGRRKNKKKAEPTPTSDASGEFACGDCGQTFNNERGLRAHASVKHPAVTEPLPEPAPAEEPAEFTCPDCGKEFARAQSLGAHRARSHGYRVGR